MLQHLQIENIALIDQISIAPSNSFNVLTGETGAGKSIIIDSINFVLGGRVSKEFIKTGKEKAIVEAVFDSFEKMRGFFEENGLKFDEESIILYREFNAAGKSIARVNGRIVNTSMLAEIGAYLVDMHGQHDNQSLMKSALHMTLLDLFCGKELFGKLSHYQIKLNEWKALKNKLQTLKADAQSRKDKIDLLRFQIDEIEKAKLAIGEDVALSNRRALLKNWSKINDCMTFAYAKLAESVEGTTPSIDQIASAAAKLNQAAPYNEDISQIAEKLNELVFQLQEVNASIRDYIFAQEFSESELEEIEERLDLIVQMKKKFGSEISEIYEYYENAKIELEEIDISPEQILSMETACNASEASVYALAKEISQMRKEVAGTIETRVAKELEELEMRGAKFQASFTETSMQSFGIDKMEFLFSANKGEPVKPLSKIASGGEMSRVMLAIKSILAEVDQIPLLIFDEIDSGISGVASQKVGEKLKTLASKHQVLCVTHHAQIAAMADRHFYILKIQEALTTRTSAEIISQEQRIAEISRLLSGAHASETSMKHARELLEERELKS